MARITPEVAAWFGYYHQRQGGWGVLSGVMSPHSDGKDVLYARMAANERDDGTAYALTLVLAGFSDEDRHNLARQIEDDARLRDQEYLRLLREPPQPILLTDEVLAQMGTSREEILAQTSRDFDVPVELLRPARHPVYPCPVAECPGDGRYSPPGRGHTCTSEQWLAALDTDRFGDTQP